MCDACARSAADDGASAPYRRLYRRALLRGAAFGGATLGAALLRLDHAGAETQPSTALPGELLLGEDVRPLPAIARRAQPALIIAAPAIVAVRTTRVVPALNATAMPAPTVVTRKQWGADESIRVNDRQYAPITKLVVHHTASANRPSDPASVVRETYFNHVVGRGYSDIGYNYLIDHRGVIYEGRWARSYGAEPITGEDHDGWGIVGGHAAHMNAGTCGICLIGNFEAASPSGAALAALTSLVAWKAGRHRIDLTRSDAFENVYSQFFTFGNLAGHRNLGFTQCPGKLLYAQLPAVRAGAATMAGAFDPVVLDLPSIVRNDTGTGQGPSSVAAITATAPAGNAAPANTSRKVVGFRALTTGGAVMNTSKAARRDSPGRSVVAIASPGRGDGYAALTPDGSVLLYGLTDHGSAAGKGNAADLDITASGEGYVVVMADGGIYPFGDAGYYGSPKRNGVTASARRVAVRPAGDGYWVLGSDGKVRNFGAARALGSSTLPGTPVDIAATPSGKGYLVLMDTGDVAGFGDAIATSGLSGVVKRWAKPAAAITTMPEGAGYVIGASDGGLFAFGGAPQLGSFAGSHATIVGVVPACG